LGGGGREHALAWRLGQDPDVTDVVCAPGNPGISTVARCVAVDTASPEAMLALAERESIDLTVVGPEAFLERGVADLFRRHGRPILGPSRAAAALEWSKAFSKRFMARHGVPTARFEICDSAESALAALERPEFAAPVVIKADGLAAGKGVVVAETRAEAEAAIRAAMVDRQFGDAGETVVIEECLTGPEVSFFALCDGTRAMALGTAQDHKRIFDDDRGPNTGGMGAFSPSPLISAADSEAIMRDIVDPVVAGMRAEGAPYVGFLYVGLMLAPRGPQVIEFNVRFGDPEAQVVLPRLEGSFAQALLAAANGDVTKAALRASADKLVGVVVASRGYPASSESGRPIDGLDLAAASGALVFHSGTRAEGAGVATAGGRVLTVVGRGTSYEDAMATAYMGVGRIRFDGMQFRKDIGRKALNKTPGVLDDRGRPVS
jgi:phosphoribosylamine--glycine ligase